MPCAETVMDKKEVKILMAELVCGICGEIIEDPGSNCPFCGAEPNHFMDAAGVDRELLRKIYLEGGATY